MEKHLIRVLLLALVPLAACDLDLENPNAVTHEELVADQSNLVALAVGVQDLYASNFDELTQASALVTDEVGTTRGSLLAYRSLLTGPPGDILFDYGVVEEPFETSYHVVRTVNILLENVGNVGLDAPTVASISALAKLYKAMALGMAALNFEQVPVDIEAENPVFQPRAVVFDSVIALLESARTQFPGVGVSTIFDDRVLPANFDVENTINAMLARYHLFAGSYAEAIAAADRVDLTSLSVFTYSGTDINPLYNLRIYIQPLQSFVTGAEAGDERPAYWVDVDAAPATGLPDSLLLPFERYGSREASIPVYLPDEMKLIKAEAYTRLGNFDQARILINEVRTQSESAVNEPVADLPPLSEAELDTEAELLAQIAYERRYELYLQGLRWEDVRRLGEDITTAPTIQFLPIPRQECVTNETLDC